MSKIDKAKKRARKVTGKPSVPRRMVTAQPANDLQAEEVEEKRAQRAEDARIKARIGGQVHRDKRTGKTVSRQIVDVVSMMARTKDDVGNHMIGPNEVAAVRRLEALIEKARSSQASGLASMERVGGQGACDPIMAQVIRRHEAVVEIERIAGMVGPISWRMLRELCDGNLGLDVWHGVVRRVTGESGEKAHGGIVRMAFRELAEVMRRAANDDKPDVAHPLAG